MALAFVQSNSSFSDVPGTSFTVALTAVGAGNLIALWVKYEAGVATTVSVSDATSTLTNGTVVAHANNDLHGVWCYLLSANSGNRTYTLTLGATRQYVSLHVWEFSYTGTTALDVQNTGSGTSTAPASGTVTTTGTDEVALGGYGPYSANTFSAPLINGVAATGSRIDLPAGSFSASWYRLLTATFTGGTASGTLSASAAWICNIIAFKATAASTSWGHLLGLHGNRLVQEV